MRYFVESYGCTMNYGEGDELSKKMRELGHVRSLSSDTADIIILNTCTVVDTTEKKMIDRISYFRKLGKEVVVTGCMAKVQVSRISIRLPEAVILPPDRYDEFTDTIERRYGRGEAFACDGDDNTKCAILPIAQGCLGNCSYCITKYARGNLKSYDISQLIKKFITMLNDECKEILLTAQDTASYGRDIGTNLPELLKIMLDHDGDHRIRIGMMNPDTLSKISDDLLDVMEDTRIYRFLHIPVQSGSDTVLKRMNRRYTSSEYIALIEKMRSRYPEISISTDMITGFPGETADDHRRSMNIIRTISPDTVNITRFSPRPGTEAFSFPDVPNGNVSKDRSRDITILKNDITKKRNMNIVGTVQKVLITENGNNGTLIARTQNYRPVVIENCANIGDFVDVKIVRVASTHLFGKRIV